MGAGWRLAGLLDSCHECELKPYLPHADEAKWVLTPFHFRKTMGAEGLVMLASQQRCSVQWP